MTGKKKILIFDNYIRRKTQTKLQTRKEKKGGGGGYVYFLFHYIELWKISIKHTASEIKSMNVKFKEHVWTQVYKYLAIDI